MELFTYSYYQVYFIKIIFVKSIFFIETVKCRMVVLISIINSWVDEYNILQKYKKPYCKSAMKLSDIITKRQVIYRDISLIPISGFNEIHLWSFSRNYWDVAYLLFVLSSIVAFEHLS